ncbi:hypothetical protein [Blastopirellula marina]|uniref:Uncharacterized protein n=1 Tax=Blastopirellula marina TaxID=124 RepID=A0A2S8G6L8_9BACT|nr:hypothetical protein [Blastopirellula marina]PQO40053.1 hypothetical protein C5Y98_06990 [Blastopirellula marina]PTL45428.1 hypothetical protein C5Y97_06990 [Blastopirellula marina]
MDRNRAFRQYAATYLFSAFVLIGCAGRLPDDVAPLPSNNTYVQNGIVHEQATIAGLQPHDRLILPEGTKVERSDTNADPLVLIEKKQQIYAHPPQPISIEETRKKLKV